MPGLCTASLSVCLSPLKKAEAFNAGLPRRIIDYSAVRPASRWHPDSRASATLRRGDERIDSTRENPELANSLAPGESASLVVAPLELFRALAMRFRSLAPVSLSASRKRRRRRWLRRANYVVTRVR